MGYGTRNNGQIKTYWPDDDENTLFIPRSETLSVLLDRIKSHFGEDVDFDSLDIEAQKIHTNCLTYDLYDPSDHTDFLVITKFGC